MPADRAYLKGARLGAGLAELQAETARIMSVLGRGGAVRVEPAALLPAETLIDLYGEDIRARAYTTQDDAGEHMLRPDFTMPIVEMHVRHGAEKAAYTYLGPVWRRQQAGSSRPVEYLQAGIELFGGEDPEAADAEVFSLIAAAVEGAGAWPVIGDMGLLLAAIDALRTSAPRKRALRRHLWRPTAFRRLLQRFGEDHGSVAEARAAVLAAGEAGAVTAAVAEAGPEIGSRSQAEVAASVARIAEEAASPPLAPAEVASLEAAMAVTGSAAEALARFEALAAAAPALSPAVERLARRLRALADRGFDPGAIAFEASFGRTTLEYYDGFVFGFVAENRPDLPPVASGGRYDALTRLLGRGRSMPAVGGIVRPEALLALRRAA